MLIIAASLKLVAVLAVGSLALIKLNAAFSEGLTTRISDIR